jgi:hypothetical protein
MVHRTSWTVVDVRISDVAHVTSDFEIEFSQCTCAALLQDGRRWIALVTQTVGLDTHVVYAGPGGGSQLAGDPACATPDTLQPRPPDGLRIDSIFAKSFKREGQGALPSVNDQPAGLAAPAAKEVELPPPCHHVALSPPCQPATLGLDRL